MSSRRGRSMLALVSAAVIALLVASCGQGGDDREQIREAVTQLQTDFQAGDVEAVCNALTRDAQIHVGEAAHDPPTTCDRDMRFVFKFVKRDKRSAADRRVTRIEIDGDRATARVAVPGGETIAVPLAKDDDEWKIDALYGDIPGGKQEDHFK